MKKAGCYLLLLFAVIALQSSAQSCSITPSAYKVCLGNAVFFTISTTGTITKTTWTYGDGSTDTLPTGTHLYSKPGTYTVTVIVKFNNNTTCTTTVTQPIKVFDLPVSDFTKNMDTVCLSVPLCVNNTTTPGSSGAPIRKVTFLFGDGAIVYNQNFVCHTYVKTGNYIVTLEVEDTNGCISRIEKPVVVIDFKVLINTTLVHCGEIQFSNIGGFPYSGVKRYYWDFGDGTFDSSAASYNKVNHVFTDITKCPFVVKLFIQTTNGCSDFKTISVCPLYKFTVNITEDHKKACFRNNEFNFANPFNINAVMIWRYKLEGTATWQNSTYGPNAKYSFPMCGRYIVQLEIKPVGVYNALCDTIAFDTVDVLGPQAHIETDTVAPFRVVNHYMCQPDTAYFVTPTLYQSRHCQASVKRLWDFGDTHCPQCTTDTKNGINANSNCRWSKDSSNVKHRYTTDSCYHVRLLLWDTITGCIDSDYITVVVGRPDLSKIKISGKSCLGETQFVDMSKVTPYCEPNGFWFNKDTVCNGNSAAAWIKMPRQNFSYTITKICGGNNSVTAFVLRNGNCYDTLYYVKNYSGLHTSFGVTSGRGCAPFTTTTYVFDSIQKACYKAVWNWGDGSALTIDSMLVNGRIKQQSHTYTKNGLYTITLSLYDTSSNNKGCRFDTTYTLGVGFYLNIGTNVLTCNGLVNLSNSISYYSVPFNPAIPYSSFFGTATYSYGDGSADTSSPNHYYAKAGRYKIKIIATDTNGCTDSAFGTIKVNEFHVGFSYTPKILVCGQIVQFADSSFIKDSSDVLPADSIVSWVWDFGDMRALSNLKNPAHAYFSNGVFFVKLIVTTSKGCIDSAIVQINIKGPVPSFNLLSDSVGCAPFTIKLKNTSVDCDKNIIYFGDPSNSSSLLLPNDSISFTYSLPGIYYLYLFGEADFINPNTGSKVYCNSWYPDKSNPKAKLIRIVVLAKPPVKFTAPDTVCVNTSFNITNLSDTIYHSYYWDYGDTTNEVKQRPDTNTSHLYKRTGTYTITLKPHYAPVANLRECPDTFAKKIVVVTITPGFTIDASAQPVIKFHNTSIGGNTYQWDFGHPRSGSKNTATGPDVEHDFLNDTGMFTICMTAFSKFGCQDSVCQEVYNNNYRTLIIPNVFTINGDGINDAFDIDIHGHTYYNLTIYNRWGGTVFQSQRDGYGNDGVNWNGKLNNTGTELPAGVYYFKFDYQFRGDAIGTVKGMVTMIRE